MASLYRAPSTTPDLFPHLPYDDLPDDINDHFRHLEEFIDFESYRPVLISALTAAKQYVPVAAGRSGRAPFDPVFMLRLLFFQGILNISDREFYSQLCCDLRLQRCLRLQRRQDIPKPQTLWKYRNIFSQQEVFQKVFTLHVQNIRQEIPRIGSTIQIVDSSFVECPKQHNTPEENLRIKQGLGHTLWRDQPHKRCHKDFDARWTKKGDENHYGYKAHATICGVSKLILHIFSTPANVHDAAVMARLLAVAEPGAAFYADAGYCGRKQTAMISAHKMTPYICKKGFRNKPVTDAQKYYNRTVAAIRCRIEHVFGFIERSLGGSRIRSIGQVRAEAKVALIALIYNVFRLRFYAYKTT